MPRRYNYDEEDEHDSERQEARERWEDMQTEAAVGRDQERRAKERGEVYDYLEIGDTLEQYREHCKQHNLVNVTYPHNL